MKVIPTFIALKSSIINNFFRKYKRIILLIGFILLLIALSKLSGIDVLFNSDRMIAVLTEYGWMSYLLFFGILLLGTLMNIPGAVFIVMAVVAYGYGPGSILSFMGIMVCSLINFLFARFIGGGSLHDVENKRLMRYLNKIEQHPYKTLFIVRIFMLLSPLVNYSVAMTKVTTRQFIIGNFFASILPFSLIVLITYIVRNSQIKAIFLNLIAL